MRITEDMVKEKGLLLAKNLKDISNVSKSLITIYNNKNTVNVVNKYLLFISNNLDFINTLDKKDKYIYAEELIKFTNDLYLYFNNLVVIVDNGDRKLLFEVVSKDIKKINKLRRKIEKKYEDDDDDEFFNYAAWFL